MARKATGSRGSWFATVDGESLPCVHKHWWKNGRYHDPHACLGQPKWDEFIAALKAGKKAVLTNDDLLPSGGFKRKSGQEAYIGVFEIDEIEVNGTDLMFRFVRRIDELI